MTMMKKTTRSAIKIFLFIVIGLVISIFPSVANAQSLFRGSVTLPYEVRWGQEVLQPGDYLIFVNSLDRPAEILSKAGKQIVFIPAQFTDRDDNGRTCLNITANGNKRTVSSLNMATLGISFIYNPLTKIQREKTATAHYVQDQVAVTTLK